MSENHLEQSGKLSEVPFAEILRELDSTEICGSFRLSNEQNKIIVYLERGTVIFAVSNLRMFRLGECVVRWKLLSPEKIAGLNGVANDAELARKFVETGILNEETVRLLQKQQVGDIVQTACGWTTGEWHFSPLVRLVEGVKSEIESGKILLESARKFPLELIVKRFIGQKDSFSHNHNFPKNLNLNPTEGFLLSRFAGVLEVSEIKAISDIPELETLRNLYSLWLGGFLNRHNWKKVFSDEKIRQILSAKLTKTGSFEIKTADLTKPEESSKTVETIPVTDAPAKVEEPPEKTANQLLAQARRELETYLRRVEKAETHYEVLGVLQSVQITEIKAVYFKLAKQFHPDKLHQESSFIHKRVQNAFTALAQAYETLKDVKSRELYDFKLRRDGKATVTEVSQKTPQNAGEFFTQGVSLLERELFDQAVAYLGQAVRLSPNTPRYRANYGKAMSKNPRFKHQAEAEFQTAVKMSGNLSEFRVMLAEFYKNTEMPKRAVSELQKILSMEPNNKAARALLDSIQQ